ncbi:hypothetical protein ACFVFS_34030 [Kitasatospora sp. NPDC057692]|uniref:hypothetical protein n=1 Tax=Kitasatospora sp. NPDC057692 TaxID=3346215 RepID=UPI003686ADFE
MGGRSGSDEAYVLDLCDEYLGEGAQRQHRFDWLRGDPGADGRRVKLPVDGYWPRRKLVVEYRERQHDEAVPFFDKPDRLTVSGVHRGEQRARYDARRGTEIPAHGLRLAVIRPADLDADARGRLHRRDRHADLVAIGALLAPVLDAWPSDEDRVVGAFRTWLTAAGWAVVPPTDPSTDLEAERDGERIIAEAKGHSNRPGIDADIAYGQLLRRMTAPGVSVRYALVVPTSGLSHVLRVPEQVRARLGIAVYEVTAAGAVIEHGA